MPKYARPLVQPGCRGEVQSEAGRHHVTVVDRRRDDEWERVQDPAMRYSTFSSTYRASRLSARKDPPVGGRHGQRATCPICAQTANRCRAFMSSGPSDDMVRLRANLLLHFRGRVTQSALQIVSDPSTVETVLFGIWLLKESGSECWRR